MRILILTHSFNSLAQKIYAELLKRGHILTVEYDISDQVTESAVAKFKPDLIIAPFLKRAIPESVWKNVLSFIIHPGPPGDRGPSSLDWAILNEEKNWGVTIIEASNILDGGAIWAFKLFPMRKAKKGELYRHEIANAALTSFLEALSHLEDFKNGQWLPMQNDYFPVETCPSVKKADRQINWDADNRKVILKKINSADGSPGLFTKLSDKYFYLYDAKEFPISIEGKNGVPLGICDYGVIINTMDGAITVGHLREKSSINDPSFKKGAQHFYQGLKKYHSSRIRLEVKDEISWIYFDFYNGAMGINECRNLHQLYLEAKKNPTKTIVLKSESGFFSNGIHLNEIEAAKVPADYAWENINAMNDLIHEIITTDNKVTVAILDGNVSAGGVLLARANDFVFATEQIILNPHYKNMGNLYGSEFWTYLFPKYMGADATKKMMSKRLPLEVQEAKELGLIDEIGNFSKWQDFKNWQQIIDKKKITRQHDELHKPLNQYRSEELAKMKENFYGFDPSFHLARYNFVRHIVKSKTPLHIAIHRSL